MRITDEVMRTLWYEDSEGNFLGEPNYAKTPGEMPEGAEYQLSQFPTELVTNCLKLDGKSTEVYRATSTYPNDLATAMVRFHDYDVRVASMVCAQACERCLNVLSHEYLSGTSLGSPEGDGYAEGSKKWYRARTECLMCRHLAVADEGEGVFVEIERGRVGAVG